MALSSLHGNDMGSFAATDISRGLASVPLLQMLEYVCL
jgi:hypothetical protein